LRGEACLDFNIDFSLVRSQKLLLIPQLKQALEILYMNSQELFNYIEEQVEANPALEITIDSKLSYTNEQDDTDGLLLEETNDAVTLKEHLLLQLNAANLDKNQSIIGEYLIDNTDENGYLTSDICEVAAFFNIPACRVNKVLELIQTFDPPGICARNLKECLLIQLRQLEKVNNNAILVVEKYLDELASNDIGTVARATGLDAEKVSGIFKIIKTLEPRPGRDFYKNEKAGPLVADLIVRNINGTFEIFINDEAFPDINIAENYGFTGNGELDRDAGLFIRENVNNAVWLIKCIEQRKNIILKIAEKLLIEERGFFENGINDLKLLDMDNLANVLDIHESIILRTLSGKYLQCRWGVFELKYFFDTKELST
jgi:RNA polymerase sigma-54 factor